MIGFSLLVESMTQSALAAQIECSWSLTISRYVPVLVALETMKVETWVHFLLLSLKFCDARFVQLGMFNDFHLLVNLLLVC